MTFAATVGLIGLLAMIALIILGLPIVVVMLAISIAGFWLISGSSFTMVQASISSYNISASYTLAVVPMFVLMGELAGQTGLAEASYHTLSKWLGKIRGGLLMATIVANAAFGAVSAVSVAMTAICARIALPELVKHGYDEQMCMGAIASAGVLVSLIPPSTAIIIFCILTEISIGKALVAGVIPGIALTVFFWLGVLAYAILRPGKVPTAKVEATWGERFGSLKNVWPVFMLFLLIVGGIYMGIFPATIGGAIGCTGVFIYALARRVDKKKLGHSVWNTVLINGQAFPMLIAGMVFSRFIALSGLTNYLQNMIVSLNVPPLMLFSIVCIFYIVMGTALEMLTMLIITLPIVFPLLTGVGYDPYLICITCVVLGQIAGISPPVGMPIFIISSIAEVNPSKVFRGIVPWFIMLVIFLWILILFPQITLWLPSIMYQ